MSMPAPAPRSRLSSSGVGEGVNASPMETGEAVDFSAISAELGGGKGDEGRWVRWGWVGSRQICRTRTVRFLVLLWALGGYFCNLSCSFLSRPNSVMIAGCWGGCR